MSEPQPRLEAAHALGSPAAVAANATTHNASAAGVDAATAADVHAAAVAASVAAAAAVAVHAAVAVAAATIADRVATIQAIGVHTRMRLTHACTVWHTPNHTHTLTQSTTQRHSA